MIGPYTNDYKIEEIPKDYYMRVLYHCDIKEFMDKVKQPEIKLYIIGGATRNMMEDENYGQTKHLTPQKGEVKKEADCRVVPLGKRLDIDEFIGVLKMDIYNNNIGEGI